jgi:peroxiredoxin Q/BCP
MLKEGQTAPPVSLPASNGRNFSLKDYKGKKVVILYFYPKDDTPGCTVEACSFREDSKELERFNALVVGVSPDDFKSHSKFIEKFKLPFLLLSDENKTVCQDYGVWVEKNMYGRKYMGVARTTFIIDKQGVIIKIFHKVKPEGHTQEIKEFLSSL